LCAILLREEARGDGASLESRLAINETLFQEANDRLRQLYESGVTLGDDTEFVCECGDRQCTETTRMSPAEYEAVRREDRMLVAFGHAPYERVSASARAT
jgi:hypothetical protein